MRQSPFVNPEATKRRRNYALERMAVEGFITREAADAAKEKPVVVGGDPAGDGSVAPYFLEEVRKYLEAKYGAKALYESGLTVTTALDIKLQQAANKAVDRGLRRVDKRRGFRKPRRNIVAEGQTVDAFKIDRWSRRIAEGDIVPAVVRSVSDTTASLRIGELSAELTRAGMQWTNKTSPKDILKAGDLIDVEITNDRRQHGDGQSRSDADPRGRARRDRQPHRARFSRWSAVTVSRAASSIARRRRTGRWARR